MTMINLIVPIFVMKAHIYLIQSLRKFALMILSSLAQHVLVRGAVRLGSSFYLHRHEKFK